MSIHKFKPGETFCRGRYDLRRGTVEIDDNLILVWKGQFAYPDYRYLKDGKECRRSEHGDEIFLATKEEVINEIYHRCLERLEKVTNIMKKVEELKSE